jgi:hypothetical protein
MAKYKVKKDVTSSKGGKFFKDEIVEGTPNPRLKDFVNVDRKNDWGDNKNDLFLGFELEKVDDNTPITPPAQITSLTTDATKKERTLTILSYTGALIGVYYAYKKKKGVGGYIGFMILGGIAGSLTAHLISKIKTDKK